MKFERQLEKRELKSLDKELKFVQNRHKRHLRIFIGGTVLALVISTFFYFKLDSKEEPYLPFQIASVYVLIGLWVFIEQFSRSKKDFKNIDYVKKTNKVAIVKVESTEYIELPEEEDEGVFYLFQLANNKILSFGGQDFYPTKKFPSDNFEIATCYGINNEIVLFKTYNYGKRIEPKSKIEGERKWQLLGNSKYPNPEEWTIIDGQLDEIDDLVK